VRALYPGHGVDHGVDIRGNMEPVDVLIVANIDHNGEISTLYLTKAPG
jgi:hypothetical protein